MMSSLFPSLTVTLSGINDLIVLCPAIRFIFSCRVSVSEVSHTVYNQPRESATTLKPSSGHLQARSCIRPLGEDAFAQEDDVEPIGR